MASETQAIVDPVGPTQRQLASSLANLGLQVNVQKTSSVFHQLLVMRLSRFSVANRLKTLGHLAQYHVEQANQANALMGKDVSLTHFVMKMDLMQLSLQPWPQFL